MKAILSLHHPRIIHGSGPDQSSRRRVDIAIQRYIGADVIPLQRRILEERRERWLR